MGLLEPAGAREPGGPGLPWGRGRSGHAAPEGAPSAPSGPASLDPPKPVCRLQRRAAAHFQWPLLRLPVSLPPPLPRGPYRAENGSREAGEVREGVRGGGAPGLTQVQRPGPCLIMGCPGVCRQPGYLERAPACVGSDPVTGPGLGGFRPSGSGLSAGWSQLQVAGPERGVGLSPRHGPPLRPHGLQSGFTQFLRPRHPAPR